MSATISSQNRERYLRILRDTIRRELEQHIEEHLVEGDNLGHYLKQLEIKSDISPLRKSLDAAKEAVAKCGFVRDWFNLEKFWEEMQPRFSGERGTTGYQTILARLLVRLHGFWVFTLDDTSHTLRFVSTPNERDEWGKEKTTGNTASHEVRIHFGKGVFYKSEDPGMKSILKIALEDYLLRPGEGSVGLGLRADRGVCLRDTMRDLRGAVALEDCLTRNLSYIGLPVFLRSGDENRHSLFQLGERGRAIGHFGVFFPAPLGWHEDLRSSAEWCEHCTFTTNCAEKPICLSLQV